MAWAACAVAQMGCGGESFPAQVPPWGWLLLPLCGWVAVAGLSLLLGRSGTSMVASPAGRRARGPRGDRLQTPLFWALLLASLAALAFAGWNVGAPVEPALKLRNVAAWFLGTAVGSGLALLLAWKAGRLRSRPRPDPQSTPSPAAARRKEETGLEISDA